MFKNKVSFDLQLEGKFYQFICDHDCQLEHVHQVLSHLRDWCSGRILEIQNQQTQEPPKEEIVDEKNE